MNSSEINRRLRPTDIAIDDNKMWMSLAESNRFACVDLTTKEIEEVKVNAADFNTYNYASMEAYGDYIVFIPTHARSIAIYHKSKKEVLYKELRKPEENTGWHYNFRIKFHYSYKKDHLIFMMPYYYPAVVCMDMTDLSVRYIDDWIYRTENRINFNRFYGYVGAGCYESEDCLIVPLACFSALLKINFNTFETEVIDINIDSHGFSYMEMYGGYLWLQGKDNKYGHTFKYSLEKRTVEEISPVESRRGINNHFLPFESLFGDGKWIWMIPRTAEKIYRINPKTLEYDEYANQYKFPIGANTYHEPIVTYMTKKIGNKILMSSVDGYLYTLNPENGKLERKMFFMPEEIYKEESENKIQYSMQHGGIFSENSAGLEEYLNFVCTR